MAIKVQGIITREDFSAAQDYLTKRLQSNMKKKLPMLIGIIPTFLAGLLIGLLFVYFGGSSAVDFKIIIYSLLIISALLAPVLIAAKQLNSKYLKNYLSEKSHFLGKRMFMIEEEGLWEEGENQGSNLKWSGISTEWSGILNIEESSDMIFLYTDELTANFIPKHFFSDKNEIAAFKSAIADKCPHLQTSSDIPHPMYN